MALAEGSEVHTTVCRACVTKAWYKTVLSVRTEKGRNIYWFVCLYRIWGRGYHNTERWTGLHEYGMLLISWAIVCVMTSWAKPPHLEKFLTCSVYCSGVEVSWITFIFWWTRENVCFGSAAPETHSSGAANQRRTGPQLVQPTWH